MPSSNKLINGAEIEVPIQQPKDWYGGEQSMGEVI